jgi:hypothetical protein
MSLPWGVCLPQGRGSHQHQRDEGTHSSILARQGTAGELNGPARGRLRFPLALRLRQLAARFGAA